MKTPIFILTSLLFVSTASAGFPGFMPGVVANGGFECSATVGESYIVIEGSVAQAVVDEQDVDQDFVLEGEPLLVPAGVPPMPFPKGKPTPTGVPSLPFPGIQKVADVFGNMTVTVSPVDGQTEAVVKSFDLEGAQLLVPGGQKYNLAAIQELPLLADFLVSLSQLTEVVLVDDNGVATHQEKTVLGAELSSGNKTTNLDCSFIDFNL